MWYLEFMRMVGWGRDEHDNNVLRCTAALNRIAEKNNVRTFSEYNIWRVHQGRFSKHKLYQSRLWSGHCLGHHSGDSRHSGSPDLLFGLRRWQAPSVPPSQPHFRALRRLDRSSFGARPRSLEHQVNRLSIAYHSSVWSTIQSPAFVKWQAP